MSKFGGLVIRGAEWSCRAVPIEQLQTLWPNPCLNPSKPIMASVAYCIFGFSGICGACVERCSFQPVELLALFGIGDSGGAHCPQRCLVLQLAPPRTFFDASLRKL